MSDVLIDKLRDALATQPGVELALLFGSRARGAGRDDSDVDVAVQGERVDLPALVAYLSRVLGRPVDVVDLRRAGYVLLRSVLRDGVVVHQGVPGAAGRFYAQAITRVELDRPWWERMRDGFLCKLAAGVETGSG